MHLGCPKKLFSYELLKNFEKNHIWQKKVDYSNEGPKKGKKRQKKLQKMAEKMTQK